MIVLSRHRTETEQDRPEILAGRFGVSVLSVPFLYDLRSFGPTIERLRQIDEPSVFVAPLPVRASANLLDAILKPRRVHEVFAQIYDSVSTPFDEIVDSISVSSDSGKGFVERIEEPVARRWYPVVDMDRCTGCLECVNFCLFGVYIIGENDRPVVDQPDACRDGCPACSRICPGRAILFPMHEDATIAGYRDMPEENAPIKAEEERRRYTPDGLDDLVDRIDRFAPS